MVRLTTRKRESRETLCNLFYQSVCLISYFFPPLSFLSSSSFKGRLVVGAEVLINTAQLDVTYTFTLNQKKVEGNYMLALRMRSLNTSASRLILCARLCSYFNETALTKYCTMLYYTKITQVKKYE